MTTEIQDTLTWGLGTAITIAGASIALNAIDNFVNHPRRKKKKLKFY